MSSIADGINSLQGREAGKHCLIIGGGPSGRTVTLDHRKPGAWKQGTDFIIAINGAFQLPRMGGGVNGPDYWLMLDYDHPRPDWFDAGYALPCTKILSHVTREDYPDAIHAKVSIEEPELRRAHLGLKMFPAETGTRLVGTSALCACHLSGILGATTVSMIGIDLSFAPQTDGTLQHHPYSCRNYGEHPTTSGREMEPKYFEEYGLWSCDWFVASARRLTEYRDFAAANGMTIRDYSGGLLQRMGW